MDWQLAIEKNREALLRIIAGLYAFAGLAEGAVAAVLPRHVYRVLLRVLRPAESAVRRLIILAARGLVLAAHASRLAPVGLNQRTGAPRLPAFLLIDPLKRFAPFAGTNEDAGCWIGHDFMDMDDLEDGENFSDDGDLDDSYGGVPSLPRISVPGYYDPALVVPALPSPLDLINAAHLTARLRALHRALNNLPSQARRLARWYAKRDLALRGNTTVRRLSPFRPGLPPGLNVRPTHEVHAILRECHLLMLDARDMPDTS
jgi:hypothetical protein